MPRLLPHLENWDEPILKEGNDEVEIVFTGRCAVRVRGSGRSSSGRNGRVDCHSERRHIEFDNGRAGYVPANDHYDSFDPVRHDDGNYAWHDNYYTQHNYRNAVGSKSEHNRHDAQHHFHARIDVHHDRGGGYRDHRLNDFNDWIGQYDGNRQRNDQQPGTVCHDGFRNRCCYDGNHNRKWDSEFDHFNTERNGVNERVINDAILEHDGELELRIASSSAIARHGFATNLNTAPAEVRNSNFL